MTDQIITQHLFICSCSELFSNKSDQDLAASIRVFNIKLSWNQRLIQDSFVIDSSMLTYFQRKTGYQQRSIHSAFQYCLGYVALPQQTKCLGHLIGQHVTLEKDGIQKPYVPISGIDEIGVADFMIKRVNKQALNQSLSNKLLHLNEGDKVIAKGPFTQFIYEGYGKFNINDIVKKYRYVGIISHSTSFLTPYSLIERVSSFNDNTSLSMLWVHEHEEDIVFLNQFNDFVEKKKLNLNLMLENMDKDWIGPVGLVGEDHIKKYMPPPREDTLIMVYGYKAFVQRVTGICQNMGYQNILH